MNNINDMFSVRNKVVIVTGGSGQLGTVLCEYFSKSGAKVIAIDQNITKQLEHVEEYKQVDIRKEDEIEKAFEDVFKEYGSIDCLINNAGVSTFEPFEKRLEDSFNWVVDVNIKGTFFCIQKYINKIDNYKQKQGNIINIASFYGVISPDFRIYADCDRKNSEVYGATKAGVIQMTKYFAVHLANRNIRVNAVSPGGIYNPENPQSKDFVKNYSFRCPMKRMANADEIIGAVLYLASEASSYTNGHNIVIDGGTSCW